MAAVRRAWVLLVIMVLIAVAGFAVYRLHGAFGAHAATSAVGAPTDDIRPFNPKRVMLEVFGAAGTVADINYLDVDAAPQHVDDMRLPWSYSVATTAPAVSVNVVAQGDGDVISCRITVNGDIKDQRTVAGIHPQTFCLVKSA
jgi:Mycobacterium membrane protein